VSWDAVAVRPPRGRIPVASCPRIIFLQVFNFISSFIFGT